MPAPAPHAVSAPIKPRRPSGARSTRNTIELVYSPPTESPCTMRNSVSAAGAKRPSVAYPGNSPIRKVGIAMAATEKVSAARRPNWSPIWPTNAPPMGLIRKPRAKTPKAERS
jgi:hypothetical protein